MTTAQFEDAEGRALVEAIHQRRRKPLELTVYPPSNGDHKTVIGGFMQGYCLDCRLRDKRLTDAELAAEVWHFDFEDSDRTLRADPDECTEDEWEKYIDRRVEAEASLRRFATLPHYDE
jgi:hypothetical protein